MLRQINTLDGMHEVRHFGSRTGTVA